MKCLACAKAGDGMRDSGADGYSTSAGLSLSLFSGAYAFEEGEEILLKKDAEPQK
jgi:hypothetical protein